MMTIKLIEQTKDKIHILLQDIELPIINALRRALISEVPVMAVEDVYIIRNESALFDEMLAHRIGLVPLTTDLSYSKREECTCKGEGCSKCQVILTLTKQGPTTVYSGDFKTSDPKVKPAIDKIPLTILLEGQQIELEAKAELGTGKKHAKWSAGLANHRFLANIKIDQKKVTKESKDLADQFDFLEFKEGKLSVKRSAMIDFERAELCAQRAINNEISVEPDRSQIILTFENWGQLPHKEAIEEALETVVKELDSLKDGLA